MDQPERETITLAQVRRHPTYHEVWKGYQGRYKRCECGRPDAPHFEDPPPPALKDWRN